MVVDLQSVSHALTNRRMVWTYLVLVDGVVVGRGLWDDCHKLQCELECDPEKAKALHDYWTVQTVTDS